MLIFLKDILSTNNMFKKTLYLFFNNNDINEISENKYKVDLFAVYKCEVGSSELKI